MNRAHDDESTQLGLLVQHLVGAVDGQSPKVLVFDEGLGRRFEEVARQVVTFEPRGEWPESVGGIDLALVVDVLERVTDDRQTLDQIRQLLAADGLAIVAAPCAAPGREPPSSATGGVSLRQYTTQELSSVVLRAGFQIIDQLAEGPELVVLECRPSNEVGADVVAAVAAHVTAGRWAEAEAELSTVQSQMQSEELVREYALLVGHVHLARGRLASALEAFNEASKLAGPSALPLTAMGAVAIAASDMDAAFDLFSASLDLCPTQVAALRGLGMVHESRGDIEGALTIYDMAAAQRPADRELAEKVVDLAVAAGRASAASHAIGRHVRWTGDQQWAERIIERFAPIEATASPRARSMVTIGSVE